MANFQLAAARTGRNEGGYVNNKADAGGETIAGISRVNWPAWAGWAILDAMAPEAKRAPQTLADLRGMIDDFYKTNFWDVNTLDAVSDQVVAECVYDAGVLFGVGTAGLWTQRVLNCMNQGGTRWPDLAADGAMGKATVAALNIATAPHDTWSTRQRFFAVFAALRIAAHVMETEKRPVNEQFFDGWIDRAVRMMGQPNG